MPGNVTLNTRKIVILGSRSVGKSSLVKGFIDGNFSEAYYPTIETTATKTIMYNGTEYPCEIIDTAGQDEFSQLKSQHAIGIHGYVLVYSIASRASFNMIQIIYDKILNYSGLSEIAAIIVGSKADLNMDRQVDSMDGQALAQRNNAAWIEVSALQNRNVGRAFELCLAEIEKGNAPPPSPARRQGGCVVM
ncbi:small GTPase superfamily [Mycena olivaceomarginata]|uniref:Small GTPase superfamily n=1 Tax=Mycena albidolilacea TaxID=1033008 RepID=A0AAD6Z461_9AGAR|nr:small GTPase superfamily [Mycena albidolilacea]KAJ7742981.1 small GTPase superfamily [Mycena olivaceomarginata]